VNLPAVVSPVGATIAEVTVEVTTAIEATITIAVTIAVAVAATTAAAATTAVVAGTTAEMMAVGEALELGTKAGGAAAIATVPAAVREIQLGITIMVQVEP
jgi:hypothetical protein